MVSKMNLAFASKIKIKKEHNLCFNFFFKKGQFIVLSFFLMQPCFKKKCSQRLCLLSDQLISSFEQRKRDWKIERGWLSLWMEKIDKNEEGGGWA